MSKLTHETPCLEHDLSFYFIFRFFLFFNIPSAPALQFVLVHIRFLSLSLFKQFPLSSLGLQETVSQKVVARLVVVRRSYKTPPTSLYDMGKIQGELEALFILLVRLASGGFLPPNPLLVSTHSRPTVNVRHIYTLTKMQMQVARAPTAEHHDVIARQANEL